MLYGRDRELDRIVGLIRAAREGRSAALVIRAEPGTGKSALLDHAVQESAPMRVLGVNGVQPEAKLPFAALHLLLRPLLPDVGTLPQAQADALRAALGLATRTAEPDRFLVGLATLTLLTEHGPMVCPVDDAQWVDHASLEALLFAARRLAGDGVLLLFATRAPGGDMFAAAGLPEIQLPGLDRQAALDLLADHAPDLPRHVRDRIVAEACGNPLALIELPRMHPDHLSARPLALPRRLQEAYQERIADLPPETRTLLLALAVEDLTAALPATGLPVEVLAPAERAGLVTVVDATAAFRHPLVRAAAYQGATFAERAAVHRSLAAVVGDDRRAWHLAAAATGPDEQVAAALEVVAERAREQSGYAEAADALERAAWLTPAAEDRSRRLATAAALAVDSGQTPRALELIDRAAHLGGGSVDLVRLRARIQFEHGSPQEAQRLLLDSAASGGQDLLIEAARVAWSTGDAAGLRTIRDRLVGDDGLAALVAGAVELLSGDPGVGLNLLQRHTTQAPRRRAGADGLRISGTSLALLGGDLQAARQDLLGLAADMRSAGAIGWLPGVLTALAETETLYGLSRHAVTAATEALSIAQDTGQVRHAWHARGLLAFAAALQGDEPDQEVDGDWTERARAMLDLGRGRFQAALDRLDSLAQRPHGVYFVPDQVEAAVRCGHPESAPVARFESWARASGQPWALAVLHRCLALLGDEPEEHFEYAVACPDLPFQQARSRLLYGQWLRRSRRKSAARRQLRSALVHFEHAGAVPWAEQARAELRAAGESTPPRAGDLFAALTPQELQIVRLAATGATNKEIGAQLFLSPKTVGHHLYRAYPKLGVSNRTELARMDIPG